MFQTFKKIICILEMTVFILVMCSFYVSAANPYIEIETSDIDAANEFDATVIISNNPGFAAFQFVVEFDSTFMRPLSLEGGYALYAGALTNNLTSSAERLQVYFVHNVDIVGDGELLSIRFKISDDVEGIGVIKIICLGFINQASADLEADFLEGSVTVALSGNEELNVQEPTTDVRQTSSRSVSSRTTDSADATDEFAETNDDSFIPEMLPDDGFVLEFFSDVKASEWFYDNVKYAVENG